MNKKNRLTKRGSFTYVYKKGQAVFAKLLTLAYVPQKYSLKIGFSVSNKIGKAHDRNLIKRRLRAIVNDVLPNLKNCQMVIIAKVGIHEMSFLELKGDVLRLLERARLFKTVEQPLSEKLESKEKIMEKDAIVSSDKAK